MPKKKITDAAPDVCWICHEEGSADAPLLSTGCGCRGSAGLAHLKCLVTAAEHDVNAWTACPTCKQEFTGEVDVGLARARWELVRERPSDDTERLFVANNLAVTLKESVGDNEGALKLMEEVLAVRRRTLGTAHADTLDSMINLALQHNEMGSFEDALPLALEAADKARSTLGAEHEHTLVSLSCLGAVHNSLRDFAAARPLHEECLAARRRLLGAGHLETMNSMHLLGVCVCGLGQHEEGMSLLEEAVNQARRVLGKAHPSAKHFGDGLDDARRRRRDTLAMERMEGSEAGRADAVEQAVATAAEKRANVCRSLESLLAAAVELNAPLDELLDTYIALSGCLEVCAACGLPDGGSEGEKQVHAKATGRLERIIDAADMAAAADGSTNTASGAGEEEEAPQSGGGKKGKKGGKKGGGGGGGGGSGGGGKKKKKAVDDDWEEDAEVYCASCESGGGSASGGGGSGAVGTAASRVAALAKAKIERDDAAGGFKSMRTAYDELGADAYYEAHGSEYTNPHEPTIATVLPRALETWGDVLEAPLRRVLDLGCGSGEATAALAGWSGAPPPCTLDACDPYTYEAFEKRMGRAAHRWSFEDVAGGVLDEQLPYDLIVSSFALHLIEASYLHTTLAALARSSRALIIVTPHKRPAVDPSTGWRPGAAEIVYERVRVRLYISDGARRIEDEVVEVA